MSVTGPGPTTRSVGSRGLAGSRWRFNGQLCDQRADIRNIERKQRNEAEINSGPNRILVLTPPIELFALVCEEREKREYRRHVYSAPAGLDSEQSRSTPKV
jgi:hypothetical protein